MKEFKEFGKHVCKMTRGRADERSAGQGGGGATRDAGGEKE